MSTEDRIIAGILVFITIVLFVSITGMLWIAAEAEAAELEAAPPTWYMPAGARRLVACDGARLAAYPIDGTHALLYCLEAESPLPTPLPPRP